MAHIRDREKEHQRLMTEPEKSVRVRSPTRTALIDVEQAAREGSFYVMCREVGHAAKASFRPPRPPTPHREWRVAIDPGAFARIGQLAVGSCYE
jgi:hypothetical protein